MGFFEIDLEYPESNQNGLRLLEFALDWLKGKGVKTAHGPMNFNTWFPYRFRIDQGERVQGLGSVRDASQPGGGEHPDHGV